VFGFDSHRIYGLLFHVRKTNPQPANNIILSEVSSEPHEIFKNSMISKTKMDRSLACKRINYIRICL